MADKDSVLRAMTDDGGLRVIAARTTHMVRGAAKAQGAAGATGRAFAELLTGTVLYRETMAPTLRVQAILEGANNSGQLVGDSRPTGATRGLARMNGAQDIDVGEGALLHMMRTLPTGALHKGTVAVPKGGGISEALMTYMQSSEQVVSVVSVNCQLKGGQVAEAGGYLVQLLPEIEESALALMTERLKDFRAVHDMVGGASASPSALTDELLHGMAYTRLEESAIRFECACDRVRVMASLATLSPSDIEELVNGGSMIELSCDYCGKDYGVSPEDLRGMLAAT